MKLSAILFATLLSCAFVHAAGMVTSTTNTNLTWDARTAPVMRWTPQTATVANIFMMEPGQEYKLIIQNSGTGMVVINCYSDFGRSSLPSAFLPANDVRIPGALNKSIYEITSDGANCLINWSTGY